MTVMPVEGRSTIDSNDWVAEHVMGFERGNCQGTLGGGGSEVESWFYCEWCGQQIYAGKASPCPNYPFPKFTLVDLMRKLGDRGYYVMVRYDALRPERNFTVTLDRARIADTDNPLQALCGHLLLEARSLGSRANAFANIRDAIKLLQKAMG